MTTIETTMSYLPDLWDKHDTDEKHFTVGRGKREYHIWTCGPCGLHYCYHIGDDGYCSKKRAVEPGQTVFLHVKTEA